MNSDGDVMDIGRMPKGGAVKRAADMSSAELIELISTHGYVHVVCACMHVRTCVRVSVPLSVYVCVCVAPSLSASLLCVSSFCLRPPYARAVVVVVAGTAPRW